MRERRMCDHLVVAGSSVGVIARLLVLDHALPAPYVAALRRAPPQCGRRSETCAPGDAPGRAYG